MDTTHPGSRLTHIAELATILQARRGDVGWTDGELDAIRRIESGLKNMHTRAFNEGT